MFDVNLSCHVMEDAPDVVHVVVKVVPAGATIAELHVPLAEWRAFERLIMEAHGAGAVTFTGDSVVRTCLEKHEREVARGN